MQVEQEALASEHVVARGIAKAFFGVHALKDVDVTVRRGTVHALVGENGAGKSTLGKIMAGVQRPDAGELRIDGHRAVLRSPRDALGRGVAMIAQELTLVPTLSVMRNVFLGIEPRMAGVLRTRSLSERYDRLCQETGFALPGDLPVGQLRVGEQQMVEIMRALARDVRLIIMDEPTAALSRDQAEHLFDAVRGLRERGLTVVYVSHFLKEVMALSDAITVLRDGEVVSTRPVGDCSHDGLVADMLGAPADVTFPAKAPLAPDVPVVARVRDLRREPAVNGVSFDVRHGEILGIAGLVGSGRTEVARLIFGADRGSGTVELAGESGLSRSPRDGMRRGIGLVPESRKDQGLVLARSVSENITVASLGTVSRLGVVSRRVERRIAADMIDDVDVRGAGAAALVGSLSGGNQQKVLLARWLYRRPKLLIVDEPTRGVDIGAKRAIYELLRELAQRGTAVVLISSELEEVIGLAHRIVAMRLGRVVAEFDGMEVEERDVLAAMFADGDQPAQRTEESRA